MLVYAHMQVYNYTYTYVHKCTIERAHVPTCFRTAGPIFSLRSLKKRCSP